MSLAKFSEILTKQNCIVSIENDKLDIDFGENKVWVKLTEEWIKAINAFFKAVQYSFDEESKTLIANKFIEIQLVKLDSSFMARPEFNLSNKKGDTVTIRQASMPFILSIFCSKQYIESFFIIEKRVKRRCEHGSKNDNDRVRIRFEDLLLVPNTASYFPKRKLPKEKMLSEGKIKIKSCLFNLAYTFDECWEIRDEIKSKPFVYKEDVGEDENLAIPAVSYNDNLICYYKIAKSSHFPGQSFLSYYHILEYHFLMVADESIFNSLKSYINKPNFRTNYENINKIISVIKKHEITNDETEMLKSVLKKYVPEEELINFISNLEKNINDNIYSNPNSAILGEKMYIKLVEGHALSNTAKIIKHIRNSLVHSTDRHSRNDCFMPLSETESIVTRYIPIIKFLAEKVIFATAI